jgi:hypothetical protein
MMPGTDLMAFRMRPKKMEILYSNYWDDCTLSHANTENMEVAAACKIYPQSQASDMNFRNNNKYSLMLAPL